MFLFELKIFIWIKFYLKIRFEQLIWKQPYLLKDLLGTFDLADHQEKHTGQNKTAFIKLRVV